MNSKLLTQFPSNLLPDDYSSRPRHKAFLFVAFKDLALRRRPLFKKKTFEISFVVQHQCGNVTV